ncbi:MAG: ABC transporter permease [Moraxellaceae bacterium]|nr:ABC transporter permease [Moraxellaceae bacterium]
MRDSWRWFWRDFRTGELTLLLLALVLAVTATTTLRFFSTGIEKSLAREAARLIGADLVIRSSRPIDPARDDEAQRLGLRTARTLEFSSVLQTGDEFHLAGVKAVSPDYPLRGQLRWRTGRDAPEAIATAVPAPGTLWLDERLAGLLKASIGDTVVVGEKALLVAGLLTFEPDRGGNFSAFSPRALMALDDVAATGIIQPGSRLQYRLMLSGAEKPLADFRAAIEPALGVGEKLLDVSAGRPELASPLTRASDYLSLAAIAAVILSGLAVAVTARRHAERHFDTLALMRCLGASRWQALRLILGELVLVWLLAIVIGAVLGAIAAQIISQLLEELLPAGVPALSFWRPLATGVATATLTLAGFALPSLFALGRITPLRVLRRDLLPPALSHYLVTLFAFLSLFALLALETGRLQLTLLVVGGGGVLLLALHRLLIAGLSRLRGQQFPVLAALRRQPAETATQVLGLTLGLTALLLIVSLRTELLDTWQGKMPADAPNQFALNIATHELEGFRAALGSNDIRAEALYPVVRARLGKINGKPVQQAVSKEEDDERDESLNRELNLTWSDALPKGNVLTGPWWDAGSAERKEVSVEEKLATRLGVKPGDTLSFTLAEGEFTATVRSLRKVDWDSFQPNFYMVFPSGVIDSYPASYLTSFRTDAGQRGALNALVREFPTVVFIDVAAVMSEVRRLLDQVALAVEAVLVLVLVAGLLVIWAHVSASLDSRRHEAALLRVIGASRRELQKRLTTEFLLLGALAGALAALLTEMIAAALYVQVLELPPTLHVSLWWQAPLAGALLVSATGLAGARRVWSASPLLTLRQG